jgi:hypothetical protein
MFPELNFERIVRSLQEENTRLQQTNQRVVVR